MARKSRPVFPVPVAGGDAPITSKSPRRAPMFAKGAASLENAAKSAAAEERMFRHLALELIDPSPIADRIDLTEGLDSLKRSLADEGQQIPILVRPKPGTDRFEIVTGRRRLRAMTELGHETIQAFVRKLTDEEAFIAQGVENNERLETSFIERARTILSALEAGFTQQQVEKFVGVDQSMISRMKSVFTTVGEDIVQQIGPARGVGRRKWERLAKLIKAGPLPCPVPNDIPDSAERFDAFLASLEAAAGKPAKPPAPARDNTTQVAPVLATRRGRQLTVKVTQDAPEGFLDHLLEQIPQLLDAYRKQS
ncbi:ParB/RepB/Spo0J family partition protein [Primorskyibacter sp. 2E233]|uniref:ParB/RepB/Spo0J family partition protein n=1 Tax=Primorskyibacter sp. 2E233 TaxID=3413431 RepID=UPI003BF06E8C